MRCKLAVNLDTDLPYWVDARSFLDNFDLLDFNIRQVQNVADAYLKAWFYSDSDGCSYFLIPPVAVHNGITQFISGRHRTAVLMKHLNRLPLSFDSRFMSDADKKWISYAASDQIDIENEVIELPDFPIKETLP